MPTMIAMYSLCAHPHANNDCILANAKHSDRKRAKHQLLKFDRGKEEGMDARDCIDLMDANDAVLTASVEKSKSHGRSKISQESIGQRSCKLSYSKLSL